MPVFSYKTMNDIRNAFTQLKARVQTATCAEMTWKEYVTCAIQPDHLDILSRAAMIVGQFGNAIQHCAMSIDDRSGKCGNTVHVVRTIRPGAQKLPLPNYASKGFIDDAPAELVNRVYSKMDEARSMIWKLDRAEAELTQLNDICENSKQLKVLFPALPSVMGIAYAETKRAASVAKLGAYRGAPSLPALSADYKDNLKDLSAVTNVASLIPASIDFSKWNGDVVFSLDVSAVYR